MSSINKTPRTALKICGVTRSEDIQLCERYKVEFIGLNFYSKSKRCVNISTACQLAAHSNKCQLVGVFVDHSGKEIAEICKQVPQLQILQFHGQESGAFVREMTEQTGRRAWKALSIRERSDLSSLNSWFDIVDLLLLDGGNPGSGQGFNWNWLQEYHPQGKWGLAGGIDVSNIKNALAYAPNMIDVASGAELAAGIKDPGLVLQLTQAVRATRGKD
jgi:phosphoribosylanthranilate isomerase